MGVNHITQTYSGIIVTNSGTATYENTTTTSFTDLSEYNERLNSNLKLYLGGSRNIPYGDY